VPRRSKRHDEKKGKRQPVLSYKDCAPYFDEQARKAGFEWMPRDPFLLHCAVLGLIKRIEWGNVKDSDDAFVLKSILQTARANESNLRPMDLDSLGRSLVHLLSNAPPRRAPHDIFTLHAQWNDLEAFLSENSFVSPSTIPHELWFTEHQNQLYDLVTKRICCQYRESFGRLFADLEWEHKGKRFELRGGQRDDGKFELTTSEAIKHLLAYLHQTTPEQIVNLLKTVPYTLRRT
jgi:hypothetical protein